MNIHKHLMGLVLVFLCYSLAYTSSLPAASLETPVLDKVIFKLSERAWVTTETALLKVNIHATLKDVDVIKVRSTVFDSLHKIAPGDWQITQFDRSQDNSGLEKLVIQAQVRVQESKLTHVYQQASTLSKPGLNYEIVSVEFKPSLSDLEKTRGALREKLYQQASVEMQRLNQLYTTQKYSLNEIIFLEDISQEPQLFKREMNSLMATAAQTSPSEPTVSLSNEVILSAVVKLASNRS